MGTRGKKGRDAAIMLVEKGNKMTRSQKKKGHEVVVKKKSIEVYKSCNTDKEENCFK